MNKEIFNVKLNTYVTQEDENGYLRLFGILDVFQQAATIHTDVLKYAAKDLAIEDKIWVVSKNRIKILRNCRYIRECRVKTWPSKVNKLSLDREYVLYNSNGEELAYGISMWAVIDTKTNFPILIPNDLIKKQIYEKSNFSCGFLNIETQDIKDCQLCKKIEVLQAYCDTGHHVNNAHYMDFILECLDISSEYVTDIQINYIKQAHKGDIIHMYKKKTNNCSIYISGYCNDSLIFKSLLEVKENV